ncbi:3-hydroxyacyl-ACP dehydratase FabZ [Desulfotomaculum copahuensis]|uniref:3-hydroxyacyl-[acyl-carrier-protein] dehydratase n=1 Tax=Desulfotomaculum copahuensis TaxID=1838280 RepID=A0A1B7LFX9_9FIRM|nr:3-hydroxyacyl-ACP dehydratase FabZ [Desulfotomaculum copahuensis]OAT83610.1 hypothetical protein A6M21_07970 [Desulfotomaculum copahuensis]
MEYRELLRLLSHKPPFVMLDRIEDVQAGESIHAYKNVSGSEPYFAGHFPGYPLLPGVLIIEAIAQAACALAVISRSQPAESRFFLAAVNRFRFLKPVFPGDRLDIEVSMIKAAGEGMVVEGEARVNNGVVARGQLMFGIQSAQAR